MLRGAQAQEEDMNKRPGNENDNDTLCSPLRLGKQRVPLRLPWRLRLLYAYGDFMKFVSEGKGSFLYVIGMLHKEWIAEHSLQSKSSLFFYWVSKYVM